MGRKRSSGRLYEQLEWTDYTCAAAIETIQV